MNLTSLLAQVPLGNIEGIGNLGTGSFGGSSSYSRFSDLISRTIGLLTIVAGVWFLVQLIMGGYSWISAGGDKQAMQNAQKKVTNALIGMLVTILAYTIAGVLGMFLGFDIFNVEGLFDDLW